MTTNDELIADIKSWCVPEPHLKENIDKIIKRLQLLDRMAECMEDIFGNHRVSELLTEYRQLTGKE